MFQRELEALDPEALARLQLERMRQTLARVAANPAWSPRLRGGRGRALARARAGGRGDVYRRCHMPSGTPGNPILNPYTAGDIEQWGEVMARSYVAAGVTRADVIQITPSFGLFTGGFGFHYGAERLGANNVPDC